MIQKVKTLRDGQILIMPSRYLLPVQRGTYVRLYLLDGRYYQGCFLGTHAVSNDSSPRFTEVCELRIGAYPVVVPFPLQYIVGFSLIPEKNVPVSPYQGRYEKVQNVSPSRPADFGKSN